MASSSDSFSSALSHALERLGTPNLTMKEEQQKSIKAVYQGNSLFVRLSTGFGSELFGHSSSSEEGRTSVEQKSCTACTLCYC